MRSTVRPGKSLILASTLFVVSAIWTAGCQSSNTTAATTSVPTAAIGQTLTVPTVSVSPRATVPIVPTAPPMATVEVTETASPSQPAATRAIATNPSLDASKIVVAEADLGPNWELVSNGEATRLDPRRSITTLRWSDPASPRSPELFSTIVTEVEVHPDAAAAQLAANKMLLRSDCRPISAPSVGDISHSCTQSVDDNTNVVFIEATSGNVWLKAGVYGSPRSEVKVTKAAELVRLMISRLPSGSSPTASPMSRPATSTTVSEGTGDTLYPTAEATVTPAISEGTPALKTGTLDDARIVVGIDARTPKYLPTGAKPEGPVRFFGGGERGMVSISYTVDEHHLAVEYHKGIADMTTVQGREEPVGVFTARVYTVSKEPGDPFPPSSYVVWREGDITIKVTGTLSTDELLKVARSLY